MRETLIALLFVGATGSQSFAQSACVAADDSPVQLESAESIVGKLGDLTKIKKGTFETEDEFQERVRQIALRLNLDRHIVVGPVSVYNVKYDFDREMLLIPGSFVKYETGNLQGFSVGVSSKNLYSYEGQNSYGARATVTVRELIDYRIKGAGKPKSDEEDGARWLGLVEVDEPRWEGGPIGIANYIGIQIDRDQARELEGKLNIALVYKPSEPFYGRRNWNNTEPTVASPYRTAYYSDILYGDVSCALVLDDKGKKLSTVLMSSTPLTADAEMAARNEAGTVDAVASQALPRANDVGLDMPVTVVSDEGTLVASLDGSSLLSLRGKIKPCEDKREPGGEFCAVTALTLPAPSYPTKAARRRLEGECVSLFTVDTRGIAKDISVSCSNPIFERNAEIAIGSAVFAPKIRDGEHVERMNAIYTIDFRIK